MWGRGRKILQDGDPGQMCRGAQICSLGGRHFPPRAREIWEDFLEEMKGRKVIFLYPDWSLLELLCSLMTFPL